MREPRFQIGQKVVLAVDSVDPLRRREFEIVSVLPATNGISRYRLKSDWDGHERAAFETELANRPAIE